MTTTPVRRRSSWRAVLTVPALAATTLLAPPFASPASAATGDSFQDYEAWCQVADDPGSQSSTSAPVSLDFPVVDGQTHSARANAVAQRAGAYTDVDWHDDHPTANSESCGADASFDQLLTVSAGSSGLPVGAPVTLRATVDMTATLDTRNDLYVDSDGLAEFFAEYAVEDLGADCEVAQGWCYGQEAVNVYLEATRTSYGMDTAWSNPNGYLYLEQEWNLNRESNATPDFWDGDEHFSYVCDSFPCATYTIPGQPDPMAPLVVAPGTQVVDFTTTVGARLRVKGKVNTFAAGSNGPSDSLADGLEGIDGAISAVPGSGIEVLVGTGPFTTEDLTAPTVEVTAAPAPNASGWNKGDVTVSYSAADEAGGSGVARLIRSATGAHAIPSAVVPGSTGSDVLSAEGVTEVQVAAQDVAGNTSGATTRTVRIDKSAPVITATAPASTVVGAGGTAAVSYTATAADTFDSTPALSCSHPSGSAFPLGTTSVTCTATDHVGNTATTSFDIVVTAAPGGGGGDGEQTAVAQVKALETSINAMALKTGTRQSLISVTRLLQRFVEADDPRACRQLGVLVTKIENDRHKGLTAAQADALRSRTSRLGATLGC